MRHARKRTLPGRSGRAEEAEAELMPGVRADLIAEESRAADRETPATHLHMQNLYRLIPVRLHRRRSR